MAGEAGQGGLAWMAFALMTVVAWGLYGVFLHGGQVGMEDPQNGRYKAFLFVGIAYFLTAIIAPLVVLVASGASWSFPARGALWSLLAGIVGAAGAFGVLLAFGRGGSPSVVMSIVFAGAPVVNAMVALSMHPPRAGIRWQFVAGILLAALGGYLVTLYRPDRGPQPVSTAAVETTDSAR